MIKSNDLRLGNFFYMNIEGRIQYHKVSVISENSIAAIDKDGARFVGLSENSLKPIPLTPEILEKCGFIDRSGSIPNRMSFGVTMFKRLELVWYAQDSFIRYQTKSEGFTLPFEHVKYLHQLQNLYFALTGEELTVNL